MLSEISEIYQCDFLCKENVDRNNDDLFNLQEDMRELRNLLKTAVRRSVKEVIVHEINVILVKIASLTFVSMRNTENNLCWAEVTNKRSKSYAKQNKQFQIPVINHRYELLAPKKEGYEYVNVHHEQQRIHSKDIVNMAKSKKNVSRIMIVGD
jgi:hypothetical protein